MECDVVGVSGMGPVPLDLVEHGSNGSSAATINDVGWKCVAVKSVALSGYFLPEHA